MHKGTVAAYVVIAVMVAYLLLWLYQQWVNWLTETSYEIVSTLFIK